MLPPNVYLPQFMYDYNVTNQNGICTSCQSWSMGGVTPLSPPILCPRCKTVHLEGATTALNAGYIILF